MKWRTGRVVLLLVAVFIVFFAVWTFWVPTRDPGGREIASARLPCSLSWSPDGQWLQYRELDVRGVTPGVYLADADGSVGRLLDAGHMSFPAGWLEQPTVPVVVEWRGARPSIEMRHFSIDPGTGRKEELELLFELPACRACSLAPSLTQAAVWRLDSKGHTGTLSLISPNGRSTKLWQLPADDIPLWTYWSPDEKKLAFPIGNAMTAKEGRVIVVDLNRGVGRELLKTRDFVSGLAWSPDSREIAFSVSDLNAPATVLEWGRSLCQRGITGRTTWMQKPTGFFAYWEGRHIRSVVYSVRVRDRHVRELLRMPKGNTIGDVVWSPDGTNIAAICYRTYSRSESPTIRVFDIPKAKPGDWRRAQDVIPGFVGGG